MNWKIIFSFLGGAGLGVLGSAFFFKKKYKKYYNDLYEEMYENDIQEFYDSHNAEPKPVDVEADDVDEELLKKATTEYATNGGMVVNQGPAVGIRPTHGASQNIDYTQFGPHVDDDEAVDISKGQVMTNERANERMKPPEVISENDYGSRPEYSTADLFYYTGNDTLTLDGDYGKETVQNFNEIKDILGDTLEASGFKRSNAPTICVRNYRYSTDYCIQKVRGKYEG